MLQPLPLLWVWLHITLSSRLASSLHSRCSRATLSLWSSSGGRWEVESISLKFDFSELKTWFQEVAVPSPLLPATRPSDRLAHASLCLSFKWVSAILRCSLLVSWFSSENCVVMPLLSTNPYEIYSCPHKLLCTSSFIGRRFYLPGSLFHSIICVYTGWYMGVTQTSDQPI